MRAHTDVLERIVATGTLEEDLESDLKSAVEDYHQSFVVSKDGAAEGEVEAERTQEEIVRTRGGAKKD